MSMTWQRKARLLIAVTGIAFAVVLVFAFKGRVDTADPEPAAVADPEALLEAEGGRITRMNKAREEIEILYRLLRTYPDGTTRMVGVTVTTDRGGRRFVITGDEGEVGGQNSVYILNGNVSATASDGMAFRTPRATYDENDGVVRAPGRVEFSRGRMSGSGEGFTYENSRSVATLLADVRVQLEPDPAAAAGTPGAGALQISAGRAELNRAEHVSRFDGGVTVVRAADTIEAATATAYTTAEEERLTRVELRGDARITGTQVEPGGLEAMTGRDIDLFYAADGQTLERAAIMGTAVIRIGGAPRAQGGRRIAAETLSTTLAPDGTTPVALVGRDRVELVIPAEGQTPARTITADTLDATGEAGSGLTAARFAGRVRFSEGETRAGSAQRLDVQMQPGFGEIEEANFAGGTRFTDGDLSASAAQARYHVAAGTLLLSGSEPAIPTPHVVNEQVTIDALRIDLTLAGPVIKASGSVKSELRPEAAAKDRAGDAERKRPSILKEDRPVFITGHELAYDRAAGTARYTGTAERAAQLSQGETIIKGRVIALDEKRGDLTVEGPVSTTIALLQETKDGQKERTISTASAERLVYEEARRRATYTGQAHVTGPQGDLTASRIELFLKETGDELNRVEAYDNVGLRDRKYRVDGARLTYTAASEEYIVTGKPVTAADGCSTYAGDKLTYRRSEDRITITRSDGSRTQTTSSTKCT